MMRWAAGPHVIFGMNLEETVLPTLGEDCGQMFMLEARARKPRDRMRRKAKTPFDAWSLKLGHRIHFVFSFQQKLGLRSSIALTKA
jgi:hypothetical protein